MENTYNTQTIFDQIQAELSYFQGTDIEILDGWFYNQQKTLRRVELYYNGQFEMGPKDEEGYDKYFYNITRPVVLTAEKAIDLDTKDIRPIPDDDASDLGIWMLGKETRQYLRDKGWGKFLNDIGHKFPKYGSVVAKKVKGEYQLVNLHTLINDQRVENLYDSPYVTEEHEYNISELVELDRTMPWQNIAALVTRIQNSGDLNTKVKVYERRGIGPRYWFDKHSSSTDIVRGFSVVADIDKRFLVTHDKDGKKLKVPYEQGAGLSLFQAVSDDFPYQEVHWEKIPGRWLGVGEAETVFDPQVRRNELTNLKAKALWWKSKQIFYTADDIIQRNLMRDTQNGELLQSKNGINVVQFNQQDLVAYKEEQEDWDKNVRNNTFSFDSQVGENLPSGTPYALGALLSGKSGEFFAKKREMFGLFVRDIMVESVLPEFRRKKSGEHLFNFSDEDVEDKKHLVELAVLTEAQDKIVKMYQANGRIPSVEEVDREIEAARRRLASRKSLFAKVKAKLYDQLKFHFDYVVTNEQIDLAQNLTSLSNLLVNIAKNPAIIDDPRVGKLLSVIMRKAGVNPTELGFDKQMTQTVQNTGPATVPGMDRLNPGQVPTPGPSQVVTGV